MFGNLDELGELGKPPAGAADPLQGVTEKLKDLKPGEFSGDMFFISCHRKYLSAQPDGRVEWNRDKGLEWEKVTVESLGNGKVALKSCHGKYLAVCIDDSVRWNQDKVLSLEIWTVEPAGGGFALKSCQGKYLSAQPDGRVEANRDAAKEWESFTVKQL
ncbi:MAG: hypothetical protein LBQ88_21830 [Treponema sp.]|jgi:hypothetical protein|nr:hypothetical protein [Treponema sp.]